MRAFLAIPVAGTEALLDELRGAARDVRWVRAEGMHLTLHFWASLDESDVQRVVGAAAAPVRAAASYRAQLGGLGSFPGVLWLGMSQGAAETVALQRDVERALAAAGFEVERRSFHPHVTVGRVRGRLRSLPRVEVALPPFTVEHVHLYRSHPGPGGSRYEVIETLPLSASR